ncbi:MAG TPA: hypothetical protein DDY78_15960 [Planctomycetales bacterium]|jgi:hypothetical protein|nr:hypothetical protein [Planctomycetales bacterium]
MKPPRVVGLVLCKSFNIDPAVGELNLLGVFHSLAFATWPTPPRPFIAFAALHGGQGDGTIELVAMNLETEELIYRHQRWYTVPDPDLVVHLEIKVRRCRFPAPGRYGFSLRFNGEELAYHPLDVRRLRGD